MGHSHAYIAAGPFSFSSSVHLVDRRLRIARYSLRIIHRVPINLSHLELWIILWIDNRFIRVPLLDLTGSFWRFFDNSGHFRSRRFHETWTRYLKCQKCLQRSASFPREPSKKIWLGSWTPPVSTEDVFLHDRATTYFRFQYYWRSLSSTWQQEDWTPLVYTEVRRITAFLETVYNIHISFWRFSIDFQLKLCNMAGLDPTGQYWEGEGRSRRIEEVGRRLERYFKVATWLLPGVSIRLDNIKISKPPKLGGNIFVNRCYQWWKKWEDERKSHLPT